MLTRHNRLKRSVWIKKPSKPMRRTAIKKTAKAKSAGWWQRKCDTLMQNIHKYMFTNCLVCGGKNEVGHHFITKSLSSFLRYDFSNLVPLCHSCHFKHHIQSDPYISQTIVRHNGEAWLSNLEAVRRTPVKTGVSYYRDVYSLLEIKLSEYTN